MWIQTSTGSSKECNLYPSIGELLKRLDFVSALQSSSKLVFIVDLVEGIVQHKLAGMTYTSRRLLFALMDALVNRVLVTNARYRQMKKIVRQLLDILLQKEYLFGSNKTWVAEVEMTKKWATQLEERSVFTRADDGRTFSDLPIFIQRSIIHMLDDHFDLENFSVVNRMCNQLCGEPRIWEKLTHYHFTKEQIAYGERILLKLRNMHAEDNEDIEITYCDIYHFLLQKFKTKDNMIYPLLLCKKCHKIFWREGNHPCISEETSHCVEISPKDLISYF